MSESTFWIKVSGQKVLWFICSCYEQANKETIINLLVKMTSDQRREFLIRSFRKLKSQSRKRYGFLTLTSWGEGQRLWRELQTAHISARWNQATTSSSMTSSHRNIVMYALHDALQLLSILLRTVMYYMYHPAKVKYICSLFCEQSTAATHWVTQVTGLNLCFSMFCQLDAARARMMRK